MIVMKASFTAAASCGITRPLETLVQVQVASPAEPGFTLTLNPTAELQTACYPPPAQVSNPITVVADFAYKAISTQALTGLAFEDPVVTSSSMEATCSAPRPSELLDDVSVMTFHIAVADEAGAP